MPRSVDAKPGRVPVGNRRVSPAARRGVPVPGSPQRRRLPRCGSEKSLVFFAARGGGKNVHRFRESSPTLFSDCCWSRGFFDGVLAAGPRARAGAGAGVLAGGVLAVRRLGRRGRGSASLSISVSGWIALIGVGVRCSTLLRLLSYAAIIDRLTLLSLARSWFHKGMEDAAVSTFLMESQATASGALQSLRLGGCPIGSLTAQVGKRCQFSREANVLFETLRAMARSSNFRRNRSGEFCQEFIPRSPPPTSPSSPT